MAESWFSGRAACIPLVALADTRLKTRTRLVLLALAALAGRDGRTGTLSKGEIAARCGLPATNLARELRELVAAGWLSVERQPGASSVYRLSLPPDLADETDTAPPAGEARRAKTDASRPSRGPRRKTTPTVTADDATDGATSVAARILAQPVKVARMRRHGNSWLVSFTLDDRAMVSTIFPGPCQPCAPSDTAMLDVRNWRGRLSIAGGAAAGVHWLSHHPAQPKAPIAWQEVAAPDHASEDGPERLLEVSGAAFVVEAAGSDRPNTGDIPT